MGRKNPTAPQHNTPENATTSLSPLHSHWRLTARAWTPAAFCTLRYAAFCPCFRIAGGSGYYFWSLLPVECGVTGLRGSAFIVDKSEGAPTKPYTTVCLPLSDAHEPTVLIEKDGKTTLKGSTWVGWSRYVCVCVCVCVCVWERERERGGVSECVGVCVRERVKVSYCGVWGWVSVVWGWVSVVCEGELGCCVWEREGVWVSVRGAYSGGGSGYAVRVYNSTGPRPMGKWDRESDFTTCYRLNKLLQLINVAHTSS